MPVDMYQVLRKIMSAPAVTGFEEQRRKMIIEEYSKYCDSVTVDVIGNVIGTIGSGDKAVMLAGHYDQIGFMIKYVDKDGYASFDQVGGWDPRVAYGTRVRIWVGDGAEGFVLGIIGTKAAHLSDQSERDKVVPMKDMRIDFGSSNEEEAAKMGVKVGCICTPDTTVEYLGKKGSDLVIGPAFDDVCAVAAHIEALDILSKDPPKKLKIYFVATTQEEIGMRGAAVSAYNIQPWCAIASDVTHAVAPGVDPNRVSDTRINKGPVIGVGANFTRQLWEAMEREALEKNIPYQRVGVPAGSGTDAWAIQITRGGAITGLVSIPNRYMHSPNEVISLTDLTNVGRLLAATIRRLEDSDMTHTREVFRKK
jgi:endoglucanase